MDNNKFNENFERIINNRYTEVSSSSNTVSEMDIDNMDYDNKIHQMERKIDHYMSKLDTCREKYESMEIKICNVKRLQSKSLFVLKNVQPMEEDLHEQFKNIHINYETCAKKSGDYKDLDETLRTKINELSIQRNTLMEELVQLRKNADDNDKKLARVKAMITEQEEKNAILLQSLKEKSENVLISPDITKRINTVLENTSENKLKRRCVIDIMKKL